MYLGKDYSFLFLLLILSLSIACTATPNQEVCPQGSPTPVFSDSLRVVEHHEFLVEGQTSEEKIFFRDGRELTIRQSGCEQIRQEYEFKLQGDLRAVPDSFWVNQSAKEFLALSQYGEKFFPYSLWSAKIEELKTEFKLTEALEVDPGIFIQVDKIAGSDQSLLRVAFFQKVR